MLKTNQATMQSVKKTKETIREVKKIIKKLKGEWLLWK